MQLSLLEQARLEIPHASDADRVALLAQRLIQELDARPPVSLEMVASMEANADGVSSSGEVMREGSRYVALVNGQRVGGGASAESALAELANGISRRLPRGNPVSWGILIRCNTNVFGFAYGNLLSGGGGGGGDLDPCVQQAVSTLPKEQTFAAALHHAVKTLGRCCK